MLARFTCSKLNKNKQNWFFKSGFLVLRNFYGNLFKSLELQLIRFYYDKIRDSFRKLIVVLIMC